MSAAMPSGCLADRLRGLGRLGGRAARGSGDLRRRPLHAAGPPAGQRRPMELPVGARDQHRRLAARSMRRRARGSAMTRGCTAATGSSRRPRRSPAKGAELVAVERNPIDAVWADRPEASKAQLIVHPDELAGKSSAEKRHEIADWLAKKGADAAVLAALDSIAWTFNVRGAGRRRARRSRWPMPSSMPTAPPTCSSRARRSAPMSASISAMASASTSAPSSRPRSTRARGQDASRSIPSASVAAIFEALDKAGAKIVAVARPDGAAQGDQECGRDRRPQGGAGARRRGGRRASCTGSRRKRPRASSTS